MTSFGISQNVTNSVMLKLARGCGSLAVGRHSGDSAFDAQHSSENRSQSIGRHLNSLQEKQDASRCFALEIRI